METRRFVVILPDKGRTTPWGDLIPLNMVADSNHYQCVIYKLLLQAATLVASLQENYTDL